MNQKNKKKCGYGYIYSHKHNKKCKKKWSKQLRKIKNGEQQNER